MTIRELLRELHIDFREHGESQYVTHGWLGIECVHCGRGTGRHGMGIHTRSLRVSCWKCGKHRLVDTLAEAAGLKHSVVWKLVVQLDAANATSGDFTAVRQCGRYQPPPGVGELLPAHKRYLEKRGFDPDEAASLWKIQGIGPGGPHHWRLFIPLTQRRKPVAWTTRAIGNVEPRYLSSPPEHSSVLLKHCLLGEDLALNCVVVVEGLFQAMRIGPGAVATMGVSYTESQVIRLSRYMSRCICFDNEPEAQRRASALADSLSVLPGETHVACLSGPQPDSSPPEEIHELRQRFLD